MNLDHLKLFTRIAALNNISQAGKELGLSAAVSSSHINKLERDLGVRLIHRTTRKVSLTEDGSAFLPHAMNILDGVEAGIASVGQGDVCPKGTLRITAPASFGRMHILPALDQFLETYDQLSIELHLSDSIVDLVEGGFDVAIRNAALNDSTMIAKRLATDERILCASPSYLKEYGEPKKPKDLIKHKCVNLMGLDSWTFKSEKSEQTIKTNNRLITDNGEAARDASAQGLGITKTATWCSYEHLRSGKLVQVLKDYQLASDVALWAVYPSSRLLAPKVRVFIDYLVDRFAAPPWNEK